ncbi:zinc-binding dehydrogenase [Nonomuraea wenchangensis]
MTPVVDRTYALTDAREAMRHFETGHPTGKIVVTV